MLSEVFGRVGKDLDKISRFAYLDIDLDVSGHDRKSN